MNLSTDSRCPICGGSGFDEHNVLWPELIEAWELSPEEAAYINRQQGASCRQCRGNIRSAALAKALCAFLGHDGPLDQLLSRPPSHAPNARILEVNEAGTLHPRLEKFLRHRYVEFPECDLMSMPFADQSFDLVVHSDVLEHIESPLQALQESKRILRPGGATIFTAPIVVGRLSRSRRGLAPSYHGGPDTNRNDFIVHSEFGADIWCLVMAAGFDQCRLTAYQYPSGIAVTAIKSG
ncbi:MAG: class I SAM-dependent methyltransferase [Azonexus sp.]|jgi:SAM-dependent methyltransferase|nr:class I SAM-dependent methyltransferase [Azonexus sp.]